MLWLASLACPNTCVVICPCSALALPLKWLLCMTFFQAFPNSSHSPVAKNDMCIYRAEIKVPSSPDHCFFDPKQDNRLQAGWVAILSNAMSRGDVFLPFSRDSWYLLPQQLSSSAAFPLQLCGHGPWKEGVWRPWAGKPPWHGPHVRYCKK